MGQHVFVAIAWLTKSHSAYISASIYHATIIVYGCTTHVMHACVYSTNVYDCATYTMQDHYVIHWQSQAHIQISMSSTLARPHTHTHTQADTQTDFVSVYMHVISVCAQELNHEGQEIVEPEICHEMQIQHA